MHHKIIVVPVLILTFTATILCQCVPTNNATRLTDPLSTSRIITFDNLGLSKPYTIPGGSFFDLSMENQSISIISQGELICRIVKSPINELIWESDTYWAGSNKEKPGYFFFGIGNICTFYFNPPITAFVARVNAVGIPTNAWLTIYDAQSHPLDCQSIPENPITNTYFDIGFASTTPISYINLFISGYNYYFLDNLQIVTCDPGFVFNVTECIDVDECLTDACGEHESCTNTPGSYSCACIEGYERNNETCVDIDECTTQSPCSSFATCANTNGSFTCTCNDGYEGDGVGQLPQSPVSDEGPSSSNSPDGSSTGQPSQSPTSGPSSSPDGSRTNQPSSSITSSAYFVTATINLVLWVVLSIVAM